MKERILEVEHSPGEELVLRFRPPKKALFSGAEGHAKVAGKEVLLALRSLIDAAIESLEREEKRKEKTHIEVK